MAAWPGRVKYRNKRTKISGRSFASRFEGDLFLMLEHLQKIGEIRDLKCQVSCYLTDARILYKPDFSFVRDGQTVFAEAKGFETAVWRIKRRLWKHYGDGVLEVYKQGRSGPFLSETITPV